MTALTTALTTALSWTALATRGDAVLGWLRHLWSQATEIWLSGGWAMIPIAVIAMGMFGMGASIWLRLRGKGFASVPEHRWRHWVEHPAERRGPIGELLDFVTGGSTLQETVEACKQLTMSETAPFARDLRVMKVCVGAAPLVGLLGTVTGMLATFDALSSGSGGDKTMAMIAGGISQALITTETGLVIALPGVFFQYQLSRRFERYKAFLAHLETVCTQTVYRRSRERARAAAEPALERGARRELERAVS